MEQIPIIQPISRVVDAVERPIDAVDGTSQDSPQVPSSSVGDVHETRGSSVQGGAERSLGEAIPIRASRRNIRPPDRYGDWQYANLSLGDQFDYALHVVHDEPFDLDEALKSSDSSKWLCAMEEELESLKKNKTWELVPPPQGSRAIGCKWVFKVKDDGRYKARLVAKGFSQRKGLEYDEIFSPVVRHTSIRILLAIVASHDLELEQLDVKTAFLHGDLEEAIYMKQPEGFVVDGKENWVCRLKKSLYGLKQSPRQWYKRFDSFMLSLGFDRSIKDACVYFKHLKNGYWVYLLLYVDDMLIASKDKAEIDRLKSKLKAEFEMKDLGEARKILGMEIHRDRKLGLLRLSQKEYIQKVLARFSMEGAKAISTPMPLHIQLSSRGSPISEKDKAYMEKVPYASAVGSLMYAMVCTRPDIAQAVGLVSRYMANPGKTHWEAVKYIFRYLRGTPDHGLVFGGRDRDFSLVGFCDSDYAGDRDRRKSTSGYVFTIGGTAISWRARLQTIVALSTTEAELIAAVEAAKEALYLRRLLCDLGFVFEGVEVNCDNQSAIHLAENLAFSSRTKHIEVRESFLVSMSEEKLVRLQKVHTEENASDMFTKSLPVAKFEHCSNLIRLMKC